MDKFLIIAGLVTLTGCQPNSLHKAQQDYICSDRGGVYSYSTMLGNAPLDKVKCFNGQWVDWSTTQVIPKEFYPNKE